MAKHFFYVCAGLLCLAVTYHLGARSATAQAPGSFFEAAECESNQATLVVVGRQMYEVAGSSFVPRGAPIPGTGRIIAISTGRVMLESGEAYQFTGTSWGLHATFPMGATPTQNTSFGELKARYRGNVEPQGVKPSTNR